MRICCVLMPAEATEKALRALEGIGAAVESERPGEAFFAVDGLRGIHGGDSSGVLRAARGAVGESARLGLGPTRLTALLAARERAGPLGSQHPAVVVDRLGLPERQAEALLATMGKLGIGTLGDLAALPTDRVADRFGRPGLRVLRLARGDDDPLRPRRPHEDLAEEIELPEGTAGHLLDRALELLVDRLLAAPQRRGRTLLGLRLSALLSGGGEWSVEQGLGRPSASARVLRSVLTPRLDSLPAPVAVLRLRAVGLGPRVGDQMEFSVRGEEPRRRRLGAALREVRAAQGPESLLKVLPIDVESRLPERRAILTPFLDR